MRLGFGCARLVGPLTRAESDRLLATAFEEGIRHFDVARSYASGDAEKILGDFVRTRRDEVTVATKFGIGAGPALASSGAAKRVARTAMRASPRLRRMLGRGSARLAGRGAFSVDEARASLEASLAALGLDHVDVLLLHDAGAGDCSDELRGWLDEQRAAGTIGAFGVGTGHHQASTVVRHRPAFASVVQTAHSAAQPAPAPVLECERTYLHGALAPYEDVAWAITGREPRLMAWIAEHDVTLRAGTIAELLLQAAAASAPGATLLTASTNPEHIRDTAAALAVDAATLDRAAGFGRLIAGRRLRT